MRSWALPFVVFIGCTVKASGDKDVLYVENGGTGINCTLEDVCGTIQEALDVAVEDQMIEIGDGEFEENIQIMMSGVTLRGSSNTRIVSAGGIDGAEAPEGVPADVVIDILAANVTVENLAVVMPEGVPTKRDIGVFVKPPGVNTVLSNLSVSRKRSGEPLEPTLPGSRGLLVFRATDVVCKNSKFDGSFEDHIHLPTSRSVISGNEVDGATRLGIVVIQETSDSDSTNNVIKGNTVMNSQSDGIQIQGDDNDVMDNVLKENGGYGILLCGEESGCVATGTESVASDNQVSMNTFENNEKGDTLDGGDDNSLETLPNDGSESVGVNLLAWSTIVASAIAIAF